MMKRNIKVDRFSDPVIVELSIFMDMFVLCQQTNTLPRSGGMLDQDSLYVHLMRHALVCQDDRRQLDEAKQRAEMPGGV